MHPLLKLYALNRQKGDFRIDAVAGTDEATIYLYDMIVDSDLEAEFWGGVSPQSFISALNSIDASTIHLRVNSPGGSVFAARAIEQAIREHKSTIVAHIDGLAASAASFLVMAADSIQMAPGAFLMIHKAWVITAGNADEMHKMGNLLEQIDGSLVKTYAARSGQEAESIASMMSEETWLDADKAVELGFADGIADGEKTKASAWDLTPFASAPKINPPSEETDPVPDQDLVAARQRAERLTAHYHRIAR